MALITFTRHLQGVTGSEPLSAPGGTVGEVLFNLFRECPALRSYICDDQGAVRKHVALFVNGENLRNRTRLDDPIAEDAQVFVAQALSGG